MAKKPGMMNDPKRTGGDMLNVANTMAKAAHIKAQKIGKPYAQDDAADGTEPLDNALGKQPKNPGKKGSMHPSAPSPKASQYSGEQNAENAGGAQHPTAPKSRREIAAIKAKTSKGGME